MRDGALRPRASYDCMSRMGVLPMGMPIVPMAIVWARLSGYEIAAALAVSSEESPRLQGLARL